MNEQKCVQNKYCSLTILYFFFSNQLRNLTGVTTGLATLTFMLKCLVIAFMTDGDEFSSVDVRTSSVHHTRTGLLIMVWRMVGSGFYP